MYDYSYEASERLGNFVGLEVNIYISFLPFSDPPQCVDRNDQWKHILKMSLFLCRHLN